MLVRVRRATLVAYTAMLSACNSAPEAPSPAPAPEAPAPVSLSPREQVIRASVAVRGLRPTAEEIARVEADPGTLPGLVDAWLDSPEFGATIRDLHAEAMRIRTDATQDFLLPSAGPIDDRSIDAVSNAIFEEPLVLVEHVVANDLPYSEIVTADYMLTDAIVAAIYGLEHDPAGDTWQISHWSDGRPHAGILSSSQVYRRHGSAGSNFHRGRANFFSSMLLCENFAIRDVAVDGSVNLADPLAVANAVSTNPACVSCHQSMDPLAANLWGFVSLLNYNHVDTAYKANCEDNPLDLVPKSEILAFDLACYPTRLYQPANELGWEINALRPPGYFGEPVDGLVDIGRKIAEDPRFAQCTSRRFWSYLTQSDLDEVPAGLVARMADGFAAEDFSAKALVREIVLSPEFLSRAAVAPADSAVVPVLTMRPEAQARAVEAITGFRWMVAPEQGVCSSHCWDQVDLMESDLYGFRAMSGGIDGNLVTEPIFLPTATRSLAYGRHADAAASWVVEQDTPLADADRRLLGGIDLGATGEADVRAGLEILHARILGSPPDPIDTDEAWALHAAATASGQSAADAWKLVISLLLQDPRMVLY
jgi:hypothetical protein